MFYIIDQSVSEIQYQDINSDQPTIGILSFEQLQEIYEEMGFDYETIEQCTFKTSTFQNSLLLYRNYSFGLLHILDTKNICNECKKIAFYLMHNLFIIVVLTEDESNYFSLIQKLLSSLSQHDTICLEQVFTTFLTSFMIDDRQSLEIFDLKLETLEKSILNENTDHVRQELFRYRRELLILQNYYEQYLNITEDLYENSNQIFLKDNMVYLNLFYNRVMRLRETTRMLSDFLTQIRESYQAQLDISLNRIMKTFTLVTTIFMPLTLIVGWYGMNFEFMPEIHSKYGYLYVIILSSSIAITCFLWFKKKHFF